MENLRGAAFMTLSMLGFAVEDALVKTVSARLPAGQIIALLGLAGAVLFWTWLALRGQRLFVRAQLAPKVLMRTGCEALGTAFFVTSLTLIPLTLASAVIQATPLVVALGAALFLGQPVGWRRWSAIGVGFAGVLLILRPGSADFDPLVLLTVAGMLGLAGRDLLTRAMNSDITGPHLSIMAFLSLVPTGLLLTTVQGQPLLLPTPTEAGLLGVCVLIGMAAYLAIVAATRAGDAGVISSFRYSRMVFALVIGWLVFRETPDARTLIGVSVVIAAGLFTLIREHRLHRASLRAGKPL
ncbi:DMT family transporter [Salibaculum halophilum]|uniref:DMT family transporter n=1 Tax=Salibaculum halophilum TaxID=1914408 RepID=UPI000A10AE32|nr:DMT family transporter [Salibaculum halophilum]